MAPKSPRPIFWLWVGLVFLFGLFCSCCWDGEREVEALKVCWDGWDGVCMLGRTMGEDVGTQVCSL